MLAKKSDINEYHISEIKAGLDEVRAGDVIPHEEVVKIMEAKIAARMVEYREKQSHRD